MNVQDFEYLDPRELAALQQLADDKSMSRQAVMRQALRMYQFVDTYLSQGLELTFRQPNGEYVRPLYHPKLTQETPDGEDHTG